MKIEGGMPSVCKGAIDMMSAFLLPALAKGPLSPMTLCDEQLHLCTSPVVKELDSDAFVQRVLASKPDFLKDNDYIDRLYAKIKADPNPRPMKRAV